MSITNKSRNELWAKSGNKCSICKIDLVHQNPNDETTRGEECYIISPEVDGPRHKPGLTDYDSIDNLLLLCPQHHKEIDECHGTYTEELLKYMKMNHEHWVQQNTTVAVAIGRDDEAKTLSRITSGKDFFDIIHNSHGIHTDYDEDSIDDIDFIATFFQQLMDISVDYDMADPSERITMNLQLDEMLKTVEQKGYFVMSEKSVDISTADDDDIDDWNVATIVIKKN